MLDEDDLVGRAGARVRVDQVTHSEGHGLGVEGTRREQDQRDEATDGHDGVTQGGTPHALGMPGSGCHGSRINGGQSASLPGTRLPATHTDSIDRLLLMSSAGFAP